MTPVAPGSAGRATPTVARIRRGEESPLVREIVFRDPVSAFAPLAHEVGAMLLAGAHGGRHAPSSLYGASGLTPRGDSSSATEPVARIPDARHAYIVARPFSVLTARAGRVSLGGRVLPTGTCPFAVLESELKRWSRLALPDLPPFQGGAVGFVGYDAVRYLEAVPAPRDPRHVAPDVWLGFYDAIIAFDLQEQRAWIFAGGWPASRGAGRAKPARERIDELAAALGDGDSRPPAFTASRLRPVVSDFDRPSYEGAVACVVEHVHAGDIFQANISQRFRMNLEPGEADFDVFRRMSEATPAPFAAFINTGRLTLASASPERFLAVRSGLIEARPIKGTRPRGADAETDARLATELLASEKDRAENVMIVDLLRNDLSRAAADGSVRATGVAQLESFAGVHHLVSTVVGRLAQGATAIDLLRGAFPCGSITGAPRVRAMEIIAALEPVRRGPYSGAIGWFGFDGDMDLSVAIRTAVLADGALFFHAGGGIVADSEPAAEYEETLVKAAGAICAAAGLRVAAEDATAVVREQLTVAAEAEPLVSRGMRSTSMPTEHRVRPPRRSRVVAGAPVLIIDNYDSFVDNLARYVGELGHERIVVRNDAIALDEIAVLEPAHIILSPGPGGPEDAGIGIDLVRRFAGKVPIFGVCLGLQVMAVAMGGRVVRAPRPVHGRTALVQHDGSGIFSSLPNPLTVTRYHSLVAEEASLPPDLEVTARCETGLIMAFRWREAPPTAPLVGVQFHPEAVLTDHGHELLANVLGLR